MAKDNIYDKKFKSDSVKQYAKDLKKSGYNVYYADDDRKDNFFLVEKNNNLAYVQYDDYDGFTISSKHKANRTTGTGFQVYKTYNPKTSDVEKGFIFAPSWARKKELSSIQKYKNFEEYQKSPTSLKYKRL